MKEARYRDGMRVMLPLMPAIVAFGASFGVLARAAGVDSLAALVMSATTFAGSAQFAVVSVLGAGGTAAAAIGAAVLLNARYAPMALAASGAFRGHPLRRLLEAQLLVDESWALSSRGGRGSARPEHGDDGELRRAREGRGRHDESRQRIDAGGPRKYTEGCAEGDDRGHQRQHHPHPVPVPRLLHEANKATSGGPWPPPS